MAEEPLSALVGMGNAAENQIRKLRQYRAEVVRRAEPGYQDEVKRINEQMGEVMKMLNQEVRRAKMEAAERHDWHHCEPFRESSAITSPYENIFRFGSAFS